MGRDVDESELLDVEDDRLGIRIRPSWAPKPNKSSKPPPPAALGERLTGVAVTGGLGAAGMGADGFDSTCFGGVGTLGTTLDSG